MLTGNLTFGATGSGTFTAMWTVDPSSNSVEMSGPATFNFAAPQPGTLALDLATALLRTGQGEDGHRLLARIAAYLDGPSALQFPLFTYERARAHALAGETEEALRTLDHAYDLGLRTTWALDLRPQSFPYVDPLDADPAFTALRRDPRFIRWRDRITADNARQLAHLRATEVPQGNATHAD